VDRECAVEFCRVDNHVGVAQLAQLEQLRLVKAAAPGHGDRRSRPPNTRLSPAPPALWSAVSVGASSAGASTSIRATSIATLPLPITTARSVERRSTRGRCGRDGHYRADELGGRVRAGQLFAGDAERRSTGCRLRTRSRGSARATPPAIRARRRRRSRRSEKRWVRGGLFIDGVTDFDLRVIGRPRRSAQVPTAWAGARACLPQNDGMPVRPHARPPSALSRCPAV